MKWCDDRLLHDVYQEIIDKLFEQINNGSSFNQVIENLITYFFDMANNDPIKVKFLYVLTNDYSFKIEDDVKASVYQTIETVKQLGIQSNNLDPKLTADDLYLMLVINSIQFLNQRFKNNPKHKKFTKADKEHLLYLIHKIIK